MCDPFSSRNNVNITRGGLTAEKILEKRRTHCKLIDWIAKQERWQRTRGAQWLGEQPEKCGSWDLHATQEMQRENYNTVFDMCNEQAAEPVDPPTGKPIRKRTKLNHTSRVLHHRFSGLLCPGTGKHKNHRIIEESSKHQRIIESLKNHQIIEESANQRIIESSKLDDG